MQYLPVNTISPCIHGFCFPKRRLGQAGLGGVYPAQLPSEHMGVSVTASVRSGEAVVPHGPLPRMAPSPRSR